MRLVLVLDRDGPRHHLDGRAVHCGTGLELLLPGGVWARVSYELERGLPVLYLPLGGVWEEWTAPPGLREGDEAPVPCERCPADGQCVWCNDTGTRYVQVQAPGPASVVLREGAAADLRWPGVGGRPTEPRVLELDLGDCVTAARAAVEDALAVCRLRGTP